MLCQQTNLRRSDAATIVRTAKLPMKLPTAKVKDGFSVKEDHAII
jgi:hypothetical protein